MAAIPRTNIIYSGTLLGPVGNIATIINSTPIAEQKQHFLYFNTFLVGGDSILLQLNMNKAYRVCLIGLPSSNKVRVAHCMGLRFSTIGTMSAIDNKLLLLMGDGEQGIGTPSPMVLDTSVIVEQEMFSMTEEQFNTQLTTQGATYT